jgi:hypothetical protein
VIEAKSLMFPTRDGTPITFSGVTKDGKVWRNDALADSLDTILHSLGIQITRLRRGRQPDPALMPEKNQNRCDGANRPKPAHFDRRRRQSRDLAG